jgi:DNA-directed RNA polymerase subunit F
MEKTNRPFKKFLKLNRKDISYVQFLIESYEGLAAVTTVDEKVAIIKLSIMPDSVSDVDKILDSIRKEVDFTEERSSP